MEGLSLGQGQEHAQRRARSGPKLVSGKQGGGMFHWYIVAVVVVLLLLFRV